jgi:hypothetical protein
VPTLHLNQDDAADTLLSRDRSRSWLACCSTSRCGEEQKHYVVLTE